MLPCVGVCGSWRHGGPRGSAQLHRAVGPLPYLYLLEVKAQGQQFYLLLPLLLHVPCRLRSLQQPGDVLPRPRSGGGLMPASPPAHCSLAVMGTSTWSCCWRATIKDASSGVKWGRKASWLDAITADSSSERKHERDKDFEVLDNL